MRLDGCTTHILRTHTNTHTHTHSHTLTQPTVKRHSTTTTTTKVSLFALSRHSSLHYHPLWSGWYTNYATAKKHKPVTTFAMSADLDWEHQFCLACDRQTEGTTYCSESCRLSDFEKCSPSPYSSSTTRSQSNFYLAPAYDFSNSQTTQQSQTSASSRALTPSSSHSSLCSLQSMSSTSSDANNLSSKARQQLRDYASSFEHSRVQRRRSY